MKKVLPRHLDVDGETILPSVSEVSKGVELARDDDDEVSPHQTIVDCNFDV